VVLSVDNEHDVQYCVNVYHLLVEYFYSFFFVSFTVYSGCVLCMGGVCVYMGFCSNKD